MSAGYSGTPLAKKLGISEGAVVATIDAPDHFRDLLDPVPPEVEFRGDLRARADVVVLFTTSRRTLEKRLTAAGRAIFPAGGFWVVWPKRSSGVSTDMTETVVRDVALPVGLVDNKVCAIDDTWSGLRVVWRKELRSSSRPT